MRSSLLKRVLLVGVGCAVAFNGVVVAVAPTRIPDTYGVAVEDPDLVVLLRHRAVLLAVVGLGLAVSGLRRELRVLAVPAAGAGMGAFVLLAVGADVNGHQRGVAALDGVLLALLALAVALPDRGATGGDRAARWGRPGATGTRRRPVRTRPAGPVQHGDLGTAATGGGAAGALRRRSRTGQPYRGAQNT